MAEATAVEPSESDMAFTGFFDDRSPPHYKKRTRQSTTSGSGSSSHRTRSNSSLDNLSQSEVESNPKRCSKCRSCPAREKLSASLWSDRHTKKLRWFPAAFPVFSYSSSPYYGIPASDEVGKLSSLCPIMQWLFEPGKWDIEGVAVDNDLKRDIFQKLEESYIYRNTSELKIKTMQIPLEQLTDVKLMEIVEAFKDIPPSSVRGLVALFQTWRLICVASKIDESQLDSLVGSLLYHVLLEEVSDFTPVHYLIRKTRETRRQLKICQESMNTESDVELHIRDDVVRGGDQGFVQYKLLLISENKVNKNVMNRGFPQMACQFSAAAKEALISTNDQYILYGVSLCGTEGVLLSRAHVWKGLTERPVTCLDKEPTVENSYFFYRFMGGAEKLAGTLDFVPFLTLFLAFKALLLFHQKTK